MSLAVAGIIMSIPYVMDMITQTIKIFGNSTVRRKLKYQLEKLANKRGQLEIDMDKLNDIITGISQQFNLGWSREDYHKLHEKYLLVKQQFDKTKKQLVDTNDLIEKSSDAVTDYDMASDPVTTTRNLINANKIIKESDSNE